VKASDDVRRSHSPEMKMGNAKRFVADKRSENPGAIYDPCLPLHKPTQPKFSFGKPPPINRKGRKIETVASTPINIGPNSYFRNGYPDEVVTSSQPAYKFPKAPKPDVAMNLAAVNETYED